MLFKSVRQSAAPLTDAEKLAWIRLSRTENVGPITFYRFIEQFGSASKALEAIPTLTAKSKKQLVIPPLAAIEKEYERVRKNGGDMITAADDVYPLALAATEDAPPVLSVLGNLDLLNKATIGIVGARNSSINGLKFAEKLAKELGEAGQVIASGLARGIDRAAHNGSLETGTIAVVAGGIDIIYPRENEKLYAEIREKGAILAENPLGVSPRSRDFPRRNRIVSGISQGVVVVEATVRSGSLITARLAGEQGRDVYAVPGHPLDPRASGPNALIRDGATLVRDAADILESINSFSGNQLSDVARPTYSVPLAANDEIIEAVHRPDATEAKTLLMNAMSFTPCEINELIRSADIPASLAQTILLELELCGEIQRLPGNRVMLVHA